MAEAMSDLGSPPLKFLTGLALKFNDGKRRNDVKVTLKASGREYQAELSETGDIRWEESIPWQSESGTALVAIQWKRWRRLVTTVATIEVPMADHNDSDLFDVSDAKRKLTVTFHLSTPSVEAVRHEVVVAAAHCPIGASEATDAEHASVNQVTAQPPSARLETNSGSQSEHSHKATLPEREVDVLTEEAKSALQETEAQLRKKQVVLDKLGKLGGVLDMLKAAGEALSAIHPAANAAAKGLGFLIETCEKQKKCRDEALRLVENFDAFLVIQYHVEELKERTETKRAVKRMLELVEEVCTYIREHTSNGILGNLFGKEYGERVDDFKVEFERAQKSLDRSVGLEIFKSVDGIEWSSQLGLLRQELNARDIAHFKSGKENICLKGTREDLRRRIEDWIEARHTTGEEKLFWLHGKAGSGKSAVANTVAATAQDQDYLLSCFFCKRDDGYLSNPRNLLPALAFRFAQQHDSYRVALMKLFHEGTRGVGIVETTDIPTQLERLFTKLLPSITDPCRPHVIVVDALDESGSPKEQKELAKAVLELSRTAPWVKVFLTSRDEDGISKVVLDAGKQCIVRDINQENDADHDIELYSLFQSRALDLQLSEDETRLLVHRADGLFIWCSTLFRYLSDLVDPQGALDDFFKGDTQQGSFDQLHLLYRQVLELAVKAPRDVVSMRAILSIISLASVNRPLSIAAISSFLNGYDGCQPESRSGVPVGNLVKRLHAVLYIQDAENGVVRAYHKSFYDFLDEQFRTPETGWPRLDDVQLQMLRRSLAIMRQELRFNICQLDSPVLNENVADLENRIQASVSEELHYGSRFWFTHLLPSHLFEQDIHFAVSDLFGTERLLFWLECLSLQGSLHLGILGLEKASNIFKDLAAVAYDAQRFISAFGEAMNSIAHIYLSALFWLPDNSMTRKNINSVCKDLGVIKNKKRDWDAQVWERVPVSYTSLRDITFSPDGRFVTCAASNGLLYTWNVQSGEMEGAPLRGHSGGATSVAYSPNSHLIVSASDDNTVRMWNSVTGEAVGEPLRGHTLGVNSVAFSPNGAFIASASNDCTIRIWNVQTRGLEVQSLQGHKTHVCTAVYSPDGHLLASGSWDRTIRLWDAHSGEPVGEPLQGHTDGVVALRFSPDGQFLASGSWDNTVRIWDWRSGSQVGEPFQRHDRGVSSVAYSPDGCSLVSGSFDRTIKVSDVKTGAAICSPLRHSQPIRGIAYSRNGRLLAACTPGGMVCIWDTSVIATAEDSPANAITTSMSSIAFSPNGNFLAAGAEDGNVYIYELQTGTAVGNPLQGHSNWVNTVAYSPDGAFIVSASGDETVRIWDARAHTAIGEPLRGHVKEVCSVAITPDGRRIVSCGVDQTVRIWDAKTGSPVGAPLRGHTDQVWSVACSPDGRLIASASQDWTIRLWDAKTGAPIGSPLNAQTSVLFSVTFSPNSHFIVSCSVDPNTIRVWDVRTGEATGSLLKAHSSYVRSMACSPNGRFLVSGSNDTTVRLWDLQTGKAFSEPLRGHSDSVRSVACSPDGRFFASASRDNKIYIYDAPSETTQKPPLYQRWREACSRMDLQDGWIKDGDMLLLWVPVAHRRSIQNGACACIGSTEPTVFDSDVDVDVLYGYSGRNWIKVYSELAELAP